MFSILFGIIEIVGFSFILTNVFTQFKLGNTSFLPCVGLTVFLLWIAQKITNMAQPTLEVEDEQ